MADKDLLYDFLLRFGDGLYGAASDLQQRYDRCGTHIEFMTTQALRHMLVDELPDTIEDILVDMRVKDDFDFWDFYSLKRGVTVLPGSPVKTKVRSWLVRMLNRLIRRLSK